jgi:hypothetical protein
MADTEQKKLAQISKLVYPFQKSAEAGKAGAKPTDIDDPQVYFDALSNAQDGFYPIGANGQWHGGIHFDTQTGNTLAQEDGIRCIGDGEVVAYRIDSKYPNVDFSAGKATYSRGFVLVRHRLELPPAPKQTAQPAPAGPGAANTAPSTPQPAAQPAATPDQKAKEPSLLDHSNQRINDRISNAIIGITGVMLIAGLVSANDLRMPIQSCSGSSSRNRRVSGIRLVQNSNFDCSTCSISQSQLIAAIVLLDLPSVDITLQCLSRILDRLGGRHDGSTHAY